MGRTPTKKVRGRPPKIRKPYLQNNSGRPKTSVESASKSTIYRRAHDVIEAAESKIEVVKLALNILKKKNKPNAFPDSTEITVKKHTKESALALYLENNYSQQQWNTLSKDSRERTGKNNIYPSYRQIKLAKDECIPTGCTYSETEAKVSLQGICNKTVERLCISLANEWTAEEMLDVVMLLTYGFDSSAGHLNPHQGYEEGGVQTHSSTQSLFVSSFILIGMNSKTTSKKWLNPSPQSVRFCRPLRLCFVKEDIMQH